MCKESRRKMCDARTIVRFVTASHPNQQRCLNVRCSTYLYDRYATAKEHDICLMPFTNGQTWAYHLKDTDCTGWENHILRGTAQVFKSYVLVYDAERNIFLSPETVLSADEFVRRGMHSFCPPVIVPRVLFEGGEEAAVGSVLSMTAIQYRCSITADELGAELFKQGISQNAFITAPAGFGNASHQECVGPSLESQVWCKQCVTLARAAPGLRGLVQGLGECGDRGTALRSHPHVFEPHHCFRRLFCATSVRVSHENCLEQRYSSHYTIRDAYVALLTSDSPMILFPLSSQSQVSFGAHCS